MSLESTRIGFATDVQQDDVSGWEYHLVRNFIPHTVCGSILCRQLDRLLGDVGRQAALRLRAVIRGQDPITLPNQSEPEPYVAMSGDECGYRTHRDHAAAEMVLLRGLNLVPVDNRGMETACAGELAGMETSSQVPKTHQPRLERSRKGKTRKSKK
jgi:hypothetical protein